MPGSTQSRTQDRERGRNLFALGRRRVGLTLREASRIVFASLRFDSVERTDMKILVIGGGGREHAMAWKLSQSASVERVWCAPGNDGIAQEVECIALDVKDVKAAADIAARLGADLTVVGPEVPLVVGIADEFETRGLKVLGPGKKAAQLEGSKIFAKAFLERHGIPTAALYGVFEDAAAARA